MIAQRIPMIPPRRRRPLGAAARAFALAVVAQLAVGAPGCQPKLDPQEYGEVITTLPYVRGIEKPYPLPEPDDSTDNAKESAPPNAK
jgi:hypothetical protein